MPSRHLHQPLPEQKSRPSRTLHSLTSSFTCNLARCCNCGHSAWSRRSAANLGTALAFAGVAKRLGGLSAVARLDLHRWKQGRGCAQESVFTASTVKCVALGIATRGMHGLAVIWFECRPRVPVMLSRAAGVHGETRGWANAGLHEPFGSNHHQLNNNGRSTVSVNQAGQWLREVR